MPNIYICDDCGGRLDYDAYDEMFTCEKCGKTLSGEYVENHIRDFEFWENEDTTDDGVTPENWRAYEDGDILS